MSGDYPKGHPREFNADPFDAAYLHERDDWPAEQPRGTILMDIAEYRQEHDELLKLRRDLQSANERIEALTAAQMCDCCDGKGNTLSGAPCICSLDGERGRGTIFGERMGLRMECFDLQRQLSALQRAAREYMDDIEADLRGIKPRDGRLLRALMDLLK